MDFTTLLQQGNGWLFIPSAILLGALHGLEPGHSKTMMAAFIVSIKGSTRQAVMLGLAAAFSHTIVVWLIALGGMYVSKQFTAEAVEPWMLLISGIIVISTGIWMIWKTWNGERTWQKLHTHSQNWTKQIVDTGHGYISLSVVEDTQHNNRFQLRILSGHTLSASEVRVQLKNAENKIPIEYDFIERDGYLESALSFQDTNQLSVNLMIGHDHHVHDFDVHFHEHSHLSEESNDKEYQDAHERAHALDIQKRFMNQTVTNGQILLFGLTGGLIPCPAAVTVLLICLQLKTLVLGSTLVLSFSIGLALTLVSVGIIAAVGVKKATRKWNRLSNLARRAPYFSGVLICVVGLYMGIHGYSLGTYE
ncbi:MULTISPECIES: nickel/cobalt efflux protein RcnA [Marinomonas]|uniref:Nickel/cobalt efflux system n=2 Tax=Marinomonas TaxID=28253 RepID=A0A7H1J4H4_9GAMM|nr:MULTISPECIES: nickel/cobalt efflux protein RcnA [Marinomonas]MCS7488347.1 nickel transporter [Marinomonas sp. BSi20414]QNT05390.1 nickel/cobalt efflux protein RcnA [Marinomonas arctica]GGN37944.1 nickel/cobalt efflux system [Marinomonas arctica]SHG08746.1 nickel/cobalt exporter [Marinomonas polaris DSM 16579]